MRTLRASVLANADVYGYVRIVHELGKLDIGQPAGYKLALVFTSNPNHPPGIFGPGWRLPLFDSAILPYNNYNLLWDAPNDERYFFIKNKEVHVGKGEEGYRDTGNEWDAVMKRNGEILITGRSDPHWVFLYYDGRLRRFRMGKTSESFRVEYHHRGYPLRITAENSRKVVFEIAYQGVMPQSVRIGMDRISVEMGHGAMIASNGREYEAYKMQFLRSLQLGSNPPRKFEYIIADEHEREAVVFNPVDKKSEKQKRKFALNRLQMSYGDGGKSFVEWEAVNGFIMADSGGRYRVENPAYDSFQATDIKEQRQTPVAPTRVSIRRLPDEGEEQIWSYDWEAGVRIYRSSTTGELIRQTFIMAPGPAHMRVRKVEAMRDNKWTTIQQNSYDSKGRVVRAIMEDSLQLWHYSLKAGVEYMTHTVNGHLRAEGRLDSRGRYLEKTFYRPDGTTAVFSYDDSQRVIRKVYSDGQTEAFGYDVQGRIREWYANGRLKRITEYHPDGKQSMETWYNQEGVPYAERTYNYNEIGERLPDQVKYLFERAAVPNNIIIPHVPATSEITEKPED